ncbi:MAG: mechanosensitive ion channel [Gammaproteobacteria bacterium]|nr:mechanosensitive ion channel [Gammaproteobacteria bacterium]
MSKITQVQTIWESFIAWLLPFLPHLISAALILIVGLPLARYLQRKCIKKIHIQGDPTLKRFLINLIYILCVIFIIISALSTLGVASTSLLTVLGAASLAIGFALKDFLSNIAAGFVLIFLRPFKVGDYISVQNAAGTVTEINLFLTVLNTLGNEALFIPNNQIVTNSVTNYTYNKMRRLDVSLGIDYDADIQEARKILLQEIAGHPQVQTEPAPLILVQNLGDNAVQLIARVWVEKDYYTEVKADLLERFKARLDAAHIGIPYPQLAVHLFKSEETYEKK